MPQYFFTCPLKGCGIVMSTTAENTEEAIGLLVEQAKEHLMTLHPDVKKTHEEVKEDVSSHVVIDGK